MPISHKTSIPRVRECSSIPREPAGYTPSSQVRNSSKPKLTVELNNPRGNVLLERADSVELQTGDGTISLGCDGETFISFQKRARVRVRIGTKVVAFVLENAVGSFRGGKISILAERIRRSGPNSSAPASAAMVKIPPSAEQTD